MEIEQINFLKNYSKIEYGKMRQKLYTLTLVLICLLFLQIHSTKINKESEGAAPFTDEADKNQKNLQIDIYD
jgi:hypothetical protein